ncbi:MAG: F0F1 ATP synthase subunit gamma, partial [Candidatus Omnitrophica bacterium]|nr:F0F1 ATP synthase subunit gamma [Candidatus Omnitrophota bacterium]
SNFAKIRHFQTAAWRQEQCLPELTKCFSLLAPLAAAHPLTAPPPAGPKGIMIITSDEGFLGEFNGDILRAALAEKKSPEDDCIVLGERGALALEERRQPYAFFSQAAGRRDYETAVAVSGFLFKEFLRRRYRQVVIFYAGLESAVSWRVRCQRVLPLPAGAPAAKHASELLIEPSAESVLQGLARLYLQAAVFGIFHAAQAAEYAARLMYLERGDQELAQRNRQLRQQFFKRAQVIAEKNIRENLAAKLLQERAHGRSG